MPPDKTPKTGPGQVRPAVGTTRRGGVAPGKTDAEILKEIQEAEAAEAGKTQRADKAHDDNLQDEFNELAGSDLDFDIEALITDGSISKQNIKLLDKPKPLYCDMHTLSTEEDLLVERLIVETLSVRTLGREHTRARGTGIMAMAITRFNNARYPNPDPTGERDEVWEERWQGKLKLFKTLLKANSSVTEGLAIIYQNLGSADLMDEDTKKKSPDPQSA